MSYHMPDQLGPRHLAGASILSLLLIIAGCSSGQSTTGSALSKELSQCYTENVDLHGDIKKAYKAQSLPASPHNRSTVRPITKPWVPMRAGHCPRTAGNT